MQNIRSMDFSELEHQQREVLNRFSNFKAMKLNLDMTRGKPCPAQLELSGDLLADWHETGYLAADGTDCRNYGVLEGLPEARTLMADLMNLTADQVYVLGNSSLNLMFDTLIRTLLFTLPGGEIPWGKQQTLKFLCPAPGYDRQFQLTDKLGFELITIPMLDHGPDMDQVEQLAATDPAIKGIWCVPVYSNPGGVTYSADTCRRLAEMKTAAPDFRIMWDIGYSVHHHEPQREQAGVPDMLQLCLEAGHADRVFIFCSTSKITFAGSGIAAIAASANNLQWFREGLTKQTIGPDKLSQLNHVRFLKNKAHILAHMAKHAAILKPKFDKVDEVLKRELSGSGTCRWQKPAGGYFISIYVEPGTAARVVELAAECGVALTPAGNTYPYGKDPADSNLRLSPSYPELDQLEQAAEVICVCILRAAIEKALAAKGN